MTERFRLPESFKRPIGAFENVSPNTPIELVNLLRLAEREGAYSRLSEKRKKTLEMRLVEGLSMPQIASVLKISKQAVSQTLKLAPQSLYKQMLKDVVTYRTHIRFDEILAVYSDYGLYLNRKKKSR